MLRIILGITLALLLVGTLTLAFDVESVRAQSETVTVNSDGSVTPSNAPISSADNVTYTFTANMSYPTYNGIIIQRSNIVIDGNGYTVLGDFRGAGYPLDTGWHIGLDLTDTSNVSIENANVEKFLRGVYIDSSSNSIISGNNATANYAGIDLGNSSNNNVIGNNATANSYGILLDASSNNTVSWNNLTANRYDGIHLESSSNNTVSDNNATANGLAGISPMAISYGGISLEFSSNNNTVNGNIVTANNIVGVWLSSSSGNVLSDNMLENNTHNFGVAGYILSDFMNSVYNSNLVNGKPIYYITNKSNLTISPEDYPDIGYLAAVNCTNITVQVLTLTHDAQGILLAFTNDSRITNNDLTSNGEGILLESSSNNTISGNTITGNFNGIFLVSSSSNTVSGNNATANSYAGIYLYSSNNNEIYHNDFVNNTLQVVSSNSTNVWDVGYPSGGNYWSDYQTKYPNATENDSTGIWNTPYVIDTNNTDHYPLMAPVTIVPSFHHSSFCHCL